MVVYTVGHSNHPIEEFLKLLVKHNINCICDVRSMPYSRFTEQYNRENIKEYLSEHNIKYLFFGEEFGARREEKSLLTDGMVDFEKVAKNEKFIKGIERIEKGLEKGYRIALMCTEKEPIECHRTILVSRNLFLKGMVILHILSDGTAVYHEKIEEELVEKYFPNRNQLSLFDMNETIDYLKEAYKKANNDIGYRKEDDDE